MRISEPPEIGEPGPGEAIVRVAWCGICGSDLAEYLHGPEVIRAGPHPLTGVAPPIVLGHEFSGTVVATGEDVPVAVGTRVAVDPCWRCGGCFWCLRGEYHLCPRGGAVGLASHGALAPLVLVPAAGLVPLPDGLDLRLAALAEPLAVALHATRRANLVIGDRVLITGFGPIGAAVLLAARAGGASWIVVVEATPERRSRAAELGADLVLDPQADDVRRTVFASTQRIGPDVAFECSGSGVALDMAIATVRRGGVVVMVGIGHAAVGIEPKQIVLFERQLIGSIGYCHDLERAVVLLGSGQLDASTLITAEVPLAQSITGGFDRLATSAGDLKILIEIGG